MTWARPTADPKQHERERRARIAAQVPAATLHRAVMTGGTRATPPRSIARRRPALLELARGQRCLLAIPGTCNGRRDTTVACHSNLSIHGKGGARKADDCYSVWGCMACHQWLDQGRADAVTKEMAFMLAHLEQVQEWRRIVTEQFRPNRQRLAAQWALDQLNATPTGATP
ncbi:MAG: nuclease domain-containing protein [Pseudomonadota bacterium]